MKIASKNEIYKLSRVRHKARSSDKIMESYVQNPSLRKSPNQH